MIEKHADCESYDLFLHEPKWNLTVQKPCS